MRRGVLSPFSISSFSISSLFLSISYFSISPSLASPIVLGYYPSWVNDRFPPQDIDFKSYTHLCHAFLMADKDGGVKPEEGSVPSLAFTEAAHKAGVKVLLSLGGSGSGNTFNIQSAEAQALFVKNVLEWTEKYGYDGLDLDWEQPDSAEAAPKYLSMARLLRSGLDSLGKKTGKKYLLTAAMPEGDWNGKWYDGPALLPLMDFLNIMTYDYGGPWHPVAAHNAPLNVNPNDPYGGAVTKALTYWTQAKGWPKERLNLGLPCYGRGYDVSKAYTPIPKGAPKSSVEYLDYRDILPLIAAGWTRSWEKEAQAPWLTSPKKNQVLSYDDPESIGLKAAFARKSGMGGIFFWDISADRLQDGTSPLVAAARKAFLKN